MFRLIKKVFFIGFTILSKFTNASSLSSISMSNQECKARPEIINVNSNNPVFYPFNIKTSKLVATLIILIIPTQRYVFLISQKV